MSRALEYYNKAEILDKEENTKKIILKELSQNLETEFPKPKSNKIDNDNNNSSKPNNINSKNSEKSNTQSNNFLNNNKNSSKNTDTQYK